jgi:hypothetical protein
MNNNQIGPGGKQLNNKIIVIITIIMLWHSVHVSLPHFASLSVAK